MRVHVVLIAAAARNGTIGRDGDLPWRLPEDLKQFKRRTLDKPIVMGRKTFESLPGRLKRRVHVVLTRDPRYEAEGAVVVRSREEALEAARATGSGEVCVVGGAAIYALFLPLADELLITHVDADVPGDVTMPDIDWSEWEGAEVMQKSADDRHAHPFRVVSYSRATREHARG